MNINKDNYSEFIKDDYELSFVLGMDDEEERVDNILIMLKKIIDEKKLSGDVNYYFIEGNRLEINTSKYIIHLLVLHNGDVCQYTVNKKTDYKGNYTRRMIFESVLDTLNKYI